MEEQIKKTAARVRTTFAYFWMLPILFVLLGETGGGLVGMYAGDVRATILLAASCVPIALKLFSWVLIRKIDVVTLPEALRLYALWSGVRLALLAIPVLAGFFTYYIMLSSTGALCALIGLTASLFCLPGEGRLRKELHINKEEEM